MQEFKTSTTSHKKALEQRREQHKRHESLKAIIVKGLGQGRGLGKGQRQSSFFLRTGIKEKSITRDDDFQDPLYFLSFL